MIERRRYMGLTALPYDYEVEYLQGDNASWINTEYYPTTTTEIEVKQYWDGQERVIWWMRENVSNTLHTVGIWRNVLYAYRSYFFVNREGLDGVVYIGNGTAIAADGSTYTYTPPSTRYSIPIGLFGSYNGEYLSRSKIYYFKIWEDDVLVRNFIPVVKDNTGYMYNKVNGQLFGNAGTGEFIIGPRV